MRPVPVLHGFRPAFILAAFAPCAGWVADTVGIPSCDGFPQAYAQYAASPGIPDAVCPSILKGVETMCSSFRDGTANDRAYCTFAGRYYRSTPPPAGLVAAPPPCSRPSPSYPATTRPCSPPRGTSTLKPGSQCNSYSEDLDIIGRDLGLVRDVRTGSNPSRALRTLVKACNRPVDHLAQCDAANIPVAAATYHCPARHSV